MDNRQLDFKAQLNTVDFHGQVLQIIDREGRPYVPLKRICVNLGIDWEAQRQRVMRDTVLSEGACMIAYQRGLTTSVEKAAGKKASLTRDHVRIDDRLKRRAATALFGRPRSRKSGGPSCPRPKSQH